MKQPDLGNRLSALRKEKNLTQEELVEKSHVSVRTIQRIEAGEVIPRVSTVKILLAAMGESPEQFFHPKTKTMENQSASSFSRGPLLISMMAGAIYLLVEIILGVMDFAWLTKTDNWSQWMNFVYISLTVTMIITYALFMRGFIALSTVFENGLLKVGTYLMMGAILALGILDISTLWAEDAERFGLAYMLASVLIGTLSLVFGIGLLRLQDGMGELSRVAGVLEIIIGCALITVILFFIGHVVMIPAVVVEIILLYRGYEYLAKSEAPIHPEISSLS
ncbi:helix-turn-helix transcriptional regulator [Cytophagales bacterium LB-30]|uniref:Helix-turn-helix transcriptional regulator n=1 Tax=Shiella aurantiaca TaxID=3058365 RepID=A0ABT8F6P7_9BACT|nr:helix-turn-helix transcriptional regulator [Shiella aurantiaca]MDN4165896.1 helix-turn-helix transcriptional regulator [Shiella aurantiaca]